MAVQTAKVGRVPRRVLAGWVVDDSYHVVISEKEVPGEALGQLRYPSEHPDAVPFPTEVGPTEDWEGWIDGLNIGDVAGDFKFRMTPNADCSPGDPVIWPPDSDPVTLDPGYYQPMRVIGTGPIDFWMCWMRYVP